MKRRRKTHGPLDGQEGVTKFAAAGPVAAAIEPGAVAVTTKRKKRKSAGGRGTGVATTSATAAALATENCDGVANTGAVACVATIVERASADSPVAASKRKRRKKGGGVGSGVVNADTVTAKKIVVANVASARAAASAEIEDIFAKKTSSKAAAATANSSTVAKSKREHGTSGRKRDRSEGPDVRGRVKQPNRGSADDPLGRGDGWVDDGLGGVYNGEGWTGRRTPKDNYRIFKAHLLKVGEGGDTSLCPFDCQCCF
eukprot:TRINITY_DN22670_c0_g1_i2.p1 TRINITY_DN22670_c0_g1~~TRINITY_DN22670_c0_g1_i2.p1  ORF type:complete len:257 (-),score=53.54 TRINITY_DN22670_c0_g1_i2:66-836(-)